MERSGTLIPIVLPQPEPSRHASLWRRFMIPVGLFVLVILTRLPAILSPKALDDEQVYAVVAREMLQGGRPYIDAVERKPPLLFTLYEQVLRLGDHNWVALHLVAALWTLATMAILYRIARDLFDPATGVWAALLYGLFMAWGDYRDLAFNGELLMNLPAMAAVAIALHSRRSRWRPELFLAGALVTVAFLLKQPSGIVIAALGMYLLTPAYRAERGLGWSEVIAQGAILSAGFVAALLLTGLWLWSDGILQPAIYWTILDHGVPRGPTTWPFWRGALTGSGFFVLSTLPLWLGAIEAVFPGLRGQPIWRGHRAALVGLLILFGGSLIGVAASGQFLYHYFLQLVPVLALLAAPVFAERWRLTEQHPRLLPGRRVLTAWLVACGLVFVTVDAIGVEQHDRPGMAASYVRDHSQASDRLFVWGQGDKYTGYYLDADRRPATRYIATYPLTGHIFGVWDPAVDTHDRILRGAWDSLAADFSRHPPRYIIDTDGITERPAYPIQNYPFLEDYLTRFYREVYRAPDGVVYERVAGPGASS